jgi:protein SCO1/2
MFGRLSKVRKVSSINRCRSCAFSAEKGTEQKAKEIPVTGGFAAGRGPITFASLAVTCAMGLGITTYYQLEKEKKVQQVASAITTTGKPALGGPWVLIDSDGIPKTDASYKGEFALYYFGFTFCPDICPSELVKVGKIIDELGILKQMLIHISVFLIL